MILKNSNRSVSVALGLPEGTINDPVHPAFKKSKSIKLKSSVLRVYSRATIEHYIQSHFEGELNVFLYTLVHL